MDNVFVVEECTEIRWLKNVHVYRNATGRDLDW